MFNKRWFNESNPADTPLVILHPNFSEQHLLLPAFLDRPDCTAICLSLTKQPTDLLTFWSLLTRALYDQCGITLPALASGAHPEQAGKVVLRALQAAAPYVLVIDCFDLGDQEVLCALIGALAEKLPPNSQIVLGGRYLPIPLIALHPNRVKISLFPVDAERMLLDYTNLPTGRTLVEVYGHGSGRVLVNGREIDHWDGALPRNLFFYFADRGMVTRDEIFKTFWPNLPARDATNVFHVTKRKINELLGVDLTKYWSGFYRISPEIEMVYDVVRFMEHAQHSAVVSDDEAILDLQRALYLYQGSFLNNVNAGWADARRTELQSIYVDSMASLARLYEQRHREYESLGLYSRALIGSPLREDLARSVMTLYDQLGEPRRALATYDRLEQELLKHLGVKPDRRTIELAEKIRRKLRHEK